MQMDRTIWVVGSELAADEREWAEQAAAQAGLASEHRPDTLEACAVLRAGGLPAAVVLALDEQGHGDAWMVVTLLRSRASEGHAAIHVVMLGPGTDEVIFAAWKAGCAVYLTRPLGPAHVPELARFLVTLITGSAAVSGSAVADE